MKEVGKSYVSEDSNHKYLEYLVQSFHIIIIMTS
jgi:hypothetical protein